MKLIVAGYEIEARRGNFSDPALVTVHKLGTDARSWLTPAEALALAAVIADAAKTLSDGERGPVIADASKTAKSVS
jgi:hypothetical protein